MQELADEDKELLDAVAALPSLDPRVTAPALYTRFGNLTRVWQQINALIDTEPALAYAPDVVSRLRRHRQLRRPARAATAA